MKKTVKRVLLIVGALVLLLVLGFVALVVSAFWGNAPLPPSSDLPGGIRLVNDGMVAAFILPAGGSSVALVDCGNDVEGKQILAELSRRGSKPEDVKAIFLTHGHGDHTGGCHLFPKAEVMGLERDAKLAAGEATSRGLIPRFRKNPPEKSVKVTRMLEDGETVQVGTLPVTLYRVPGHTDGSAAYLALGVLFLGDSATIKKDGTFTGAPAPFSNDVDQNHESLRSLYFNRIEAEHLEVKVLAPAHSAPQQGTAAFETFARGKD